MRVLSCSSTMWWTLSLLPVGYIYGQEEKLRNQNSKWHLQTGGSPTFHLEPLSYKYFLSWLRRGSKPKVSSGVDLYSRGPQTSICKGTTQRACGECRSLDLTPTGAELEGLRGSGQQSASNVLISGSPDVQGLWTTRGEPQFSPPWWAWVYNIHLLLCTRLRSLHGGKMVHLINGNHFHPSALREGIITVLFSLFSFPSWTGAEG